MELEGIHYRFDAAKQPDLPVLMLFHGTGGSENDLVPMARKFLPGAAMLSPRGPVLEGRMARYFRRLAEGVFDLEDLHARTAQMRRFLEAAASEHSFVPENVIAIGFSNGANMAASLLLSGQTLGGALLLRPMTPFTPDPLPTLPPIEVRMHTGDMDPIIEVDDSVRLARMLEAAGAQVDHQIYPAGHALTPRELDEVVRWFQEEEEEEDGGR